MYVAQRNNNFHGQNAAGACFLLQSRSIEANSVLSCFLRMYFTWQYLRTGEHL